MSVQGDQEARARRATDPIDVGDALLAARGLTGGFDGRAVVADVDLDVRAGGVVAIVGRSGCGKTTLLRLLAGLLRPAAGTVQAVPTVLMPQSGGLMDWASATANAALPLRIAGTRRREARHLAHGQLAALGLGDAAGRRVRELSGGMRQRVALARTLLSGRRLLLLDEPLAAVDALTRDELHGLLHGHLRAAGRGAVLVTHDLDEAVRLADRLFVLRTPGRRRSDGGAAAHQDGRREPSILVEGPALHGPPGERLDRRGGEALRIRIHEALDG